MSEALLLQNRVNKPGTSCLGCRRRKLKCSREPDGCFNCTKSDLPCVYPTPETGVKRKRGPYKKDKPPRQRHLEDLVKYLEPKTHGAEAGRSPDSASPGQASSSDQSGFARPTSISAPANGRSSNQPANSEDLVKDALIALTKSSVSDHESRFDDGGLGLHNYGHASQQAPSGNHPNARRIFEYWHIFVTRVDPMVKVIHCPTFAKKLFGVIDTLSNVPAPTEAMLFSIYYASLSTCSAREARKRFGEAQDTLMHRYGRLIEASFGDNYEIPALESLQALVLYIICIRRADNSTNLRALFSLAVRSAQLIGLHEDPEGKYSPFEAEMRRRLWYHLCGLESRTAEEGGSRNTSILKDRIIQLPANLNDNDLDPRMTEPPVSRQGITDMTFVVLRFEIHRLVFGIWNIRKDRASSSQYENASGGFSVAEQQNEFFSKSRAKLESVYLQFLHTSRPYDWMCSNFMEGMFVKAQLIIDFPFGTIPTKEMPQDERMRLLQASVEVIQRTHGLAIDERIAEWTWYFKGYVQWHSLAIVVAELGWSLNSEFANNAWAVLDPILADWDKIYKTKKDEPAWEHVNTLIERARKLRQQRRAHFAAQRQNASKKQRTDSPAQQPKQEPMHNHCNPQPAQIQAGYPLQATTYSMAPNVDTTAGAPQYSEHTPQSTDAYTPSNGAPGGSMGDFQFDFDPNMPFPDLDFGAFNQVFNDDSWDYSGIQDVNIPMDGQNWWNPPNQMA